MGKNGFCQMQLFTRFPSWSFGKSHTKIKTVFSKRLNNMQKVMSKAQIKDTNFLKVKKFSTFGMNIANSALKKH